MRLFNIFKGIAAAGKSMIFDIGYSTALYISSLKGMFIIMTEIEEARKIINDTDKSIAENFVLRMKAVEKVFNYKKEHGLPIYDQKRELEVLEKNSAYVEDEILRRYYMDFQKEVMEISKKYQSRLQNGVKIAYSGIEGAFAHIAASRLYPNGNLVPYSNFNNAYNAAANGDCDLVVLPIENSSAGEVGAVIDMIFKGSLYINGIYNLSIEQNLVGLKGAKKDDIKTVISHRQAIEQSMDYIKEKGFDIRESTNTAIAAKQVSEEGDKTKAAIASLETAKIYGLEVLERSINKSNVNTTRFAVLSQVKAQTENEKSVLLFSVSNNAGALAKAINIIGKYGYNMTVLRSRPLKEHPWQYYFYTEIDKNVETEIGKIMLTELKECCDMLKVAGTFTEKNI